MRRICVTVTARPSYARVKSALAALKARDDVELQVATTASALSESYGQVAGVMAAEGFPSDRQVPSLVEGRGLLGSVLTTGEGLSGHGRAFDELKPDLVLTIADRHETIATAIAAAYLNIPLAHLQGGEVTGSIDEKVRHAITKLADLHLVSNEAARLRVERMGEAPATIHVTGCPSIDVAREALESAPAPEEADIFAHYGVHGARLDLSAGYVVVMQHPVTTSHAQARAEIEATLAAVSRLDMPVLWFWPNVDGGADGTTEGIRAWLERLPHVHFFRNMPPMGFIRLLAGARCIAGNSSVAIRECAWLGLPAVNIGDRQAGRDRGANVLDVGYDADAIEAAIRRQSARSLPQGDPIYGDGFAGARIAEVLATAPLSIAKRLTY
ncbi:MAG: UDP-N-acetylglucosamine 2-epimerase [Pikeienuella sp.]